MNKKIVKKSIVLLALFLFFSSQAMEFAENVARNLDSAHKHAAFNQIRIEEAEIERNTIGEKISKLREKEKNATDDRNKKNIENKINSLVEQRKELHKEIVRLNLNQEVHDFEKNFVKGLANHYQNAIGMGLEHAQKAMAAKLETDAFNNRAEANAMIESAKIHTFMKRLMTPETALTITGAVAGASIAYYIAKFGYAYASQLIGKPTLIRDTSIKPLYQKALDSLLGKKPEQSRFSELVLDSQLEQNINEIADTCEMGIQDGDGVRHVLLTGPAGTGKTMFAKALATRLSQKKLKDKKGNIIPVNYACCAGADFAQFKAGEDIAEIHKIIDYANRANGITLLFIDEIDSLLKNRLDPLASEATINRTNTLLSIFDKPTHNKIMLIGATNYEHKIDRAAFTRFSKKIGFTLPKGETLNKLFDQYMKKEVFTKKITADESFEVNKNILAQSMEGLSARGIEDICSQIYTRCRFLRVNEVSYEIAKALIEEQKEADKRNKGEIIVAV